MTRPHLLIVNAYSARNAGDAAINVATDRLLRSVGNVTLSSRYAAEDRAFYSDLGIPVSGAVIPFGVRGGMADWLRVVALVAAVAVAFLLAFASRLSRQAAVRVSRCASFDGMAALLSADVVVMCGGGYLYSARRWVNLTLAHVALTSAVIRITGTPMVMMPQSIGPTRRRLDRAMVRIALGSVPVVVARDADSVRDAAFLGLKRPIVLMPDVGFALADPSRSTRASAPSDTGDRPLFVLVCMDWSWARAVDDRAMDKYIDRLVDLAAMLEERGDVCATGMSSVASHGQDDFEVVAELTRRARYRQVEVVAAHDKSYAGTMALLRSATVVVGTRLHSCILAMAQGTPAIALGYQPKSHGTYELLKLPELCFDVETFDVAQVAHRALEIVGDRDRWEQRVRREALRAAEELRVGITRMVNGSLS